MSSSARILSVASAVATALMFVSAPVGAESITIKNPSFESPPLSDGAFTRCGIPDWQVACYDGPGNTGDVGYWNPTEAQVGGPDKDFNDIPDGVQVAYSNDGEIWQVTSETVMEGFRYTLKVYVGGRYNLAGKNYAVMLAGTSTLASEVGKNLADEWFQETTIYDSPLGDPAAGQPITVQLEGDSNQVNFDMVTLEKSALLNCGGFAPPFDTPISIKKKTKRAIPLKIKVYDVFGNELTDQDIPAPVVQVTMGASAGDAIDGYDGELLPTGLSDDGNEFRYDWNEMQWVLNMATKPYTASGEYVVTVLAADGTYVLDSGCSQTFTRLP